MSRRVFSDGQTYASVYFSPREIENYRRRAARRRAKKPSRMIDKRFGQLTVLRRWSPGGYRCQTKWECRCDCGATTVVDYCNLISKYKPTRSCGNHGGRVKGRFTKDTVIPRKPMTPEWRKNISRGMRAAAILAAMTTSAMGQATKLMVTPSTNITFKVDQQGVMTPPSVSYSITATNGVVNYTISVPPWLTETGAPMKGKTPATATFVPDLVAIGSQLTVGGLIIFSSPNGTTARTVSVQRQPPASNYLLCGAGYCLDDFGNKLTAS